MKYSAFISYRRVGGAEKAELLKAVLCKKGYRAKDIFMDTYTIQTGNYVQSIEQAIAQSKNFIVIITKGCFNNLEEDGIWVHELKLAKDLGLNIIPVYFDGIRQLDRSDLPAPISDLPLDNAVIYSHDYADASYERICSFMVGPKHINWQQIVKNNVVSIITICVAAVLLFKAYNKDVNHQTAVTTVTPVVVDADNKDAELPDVELSSLLSVIFRDPYWANWGGFSKIPGLRMTSDHLEFAEDSDDNNTGAAFKLSYEMYLVVDGKNVHVDNFGERQLCELNLYGPRPAIELSEICIGYGLGESSFEKSEVLNYIKLICPNYEIKDKIDRIGFDAYIYKIRDDVFLGVTYEAPAIITDWTFLFCGDYERLSGVIQARSEMYDSHVYE